MGGIKILVCDDQPMIHETLREYIESEGFECISAFDGEVALKCFTSEKPDLIVLDLMMPKRSGIEVCREIRRESRIPIIMLTAKGEEIDRILGLEMGADDYIVKPFSPREVVARIKVVLRRIQEPPKESEQILRFNGLQVNISNYEVHVNGESIPFRDDSCDKRFCRNNICAYSSQEPDKLERSHLRILSSTQEKRHVMRGAPGASYPTACRVFAVPMPLAARAYPKFTTMYINPAKSIDYAA